MLKKILNIESNETSLVKFTLLQSFLIGIPRIFTLAAADALFLSSYDASNFPLAYVGRALIIPLIGFLIFRLEKRIPLLRLLSGILMGLILLLAGFWSLFELKAGSWVALGLLIWVSAQWSFTGIVFWNFNSALYTVRQAKRLYGLIGTGEEIAGILGGVMIQGLLLFMPTHALLWIGVAGLALALWNLRYMKKRFLDTREPEKKQTLSQEKKELTQRGGLFNNPFVVSLFAFVSLYYFSYYFTDNAFYSQVGKRFQDSKAVAGFVGQFLSVLSFVVLFFKMFFTGRIMRQIGVKKAALLTPIMVFTGSLLVVLSNQSLLPLAVLFWFMVLTKLLERLFTEGMYRPVYYTFFQALPKNRRTRVQNFTESVVGRIAGGLAGIILLIFNKLLHFSTFELCLGLVAVSISWAGVAWVAGKRYYQAMREELKEQGLSAQEFTLDEGDKEFLLSKLSTGTDKEVFASLNLLEKYSQLSPRQYLKAIMDHPIEKVRILAYEKIFKNGQAEDFDELNRRLSQERNPLAQRSLVKALIKCGGTRALGMVEKLTLLASGKEVLVLIAQLTHAEAGQKEEMRSKLQRCLRAANRENFLEMLQNIKGLLGPAEIPWLIALWRENRGDKKAGKILLSMLAQYPSEEILEEWIKVVEEPVYRDLIKDLLAGFEEKWVYLCEKIYQAPQRSFAQKKVLIQTMGVREDGESKQFLLYKLNETHPDLLLEVLLQLPGKVYETFGGKASLIEDLIEKEIKRASQLIQIFVAWSGEKYIQEGLFTELEKVRERVLLLLGLLYPQAELRHLWYYYISAEPELRAYALEVLENYFPGKYKKQLTRLYEHKELWQKKSGTPQELLEKIIGDIEEFPNDWLRACAFYTAHKHKILKEPPQNFFLQEEKMAAQTIEHCFHPQKSEKLSILEKTALLSDIAIFKGIRREKLAQLAGFAQERKLSAKEILFEEGEWGESLFVIVKGQVEIYREAGRLALMGPGEIFGEYAALSPETRTASVRGFDNSQVLELAGREVRDFIEQDLESSRRIQAVLIQRLKERIDQKLETVELSMPSQTFFNRQKEHRQAFFTPSLLYKALFFKTLSCFQDVKENLLLQLIKEGKEKSYGANETIFMQGSREPRLLIIIQGTISLYRGGKFYKEKREGELLGEISTLGLEPRFFTSVATEESLVQEITELELEKLFWSNLSVVKAFSEALIRELREGAQ